MRAWHDAWKAEFTMAPLMCGASVAPASCACPCADDGTQMRRATWLPMAWRWPPTLPDVPPHSPTLTKRRLYFMRFIARPFGCFFFSCLGTLGVWPRTLPARARDPWTLPASTGQQGNQAEGTAGHDACGPWRQGAAGRAVTHPCCLPSASQGSQQKRGRQSPAWGTWARRAICYNLDRSLVGASSHFGPALGSLQSHRHCEHPCKRLLGSPSPILPDPLALGPQIAAALY